MNTLQDYIEEFSLLYLTSRATEETYSIAINQFKDWYKEKFGGEELDLIYKTTKRVAMLYIQHMANNTSLSPVSINLKHTALQSFFKYLCELGYLETDNPFVNIKRKNTKMIEQKSEYVTKEEYEAIVNIINTKPTKTKYFGFTSARDTLLITTMFSCGLRISEAINMRFSDIDMETMTIKVIGKGSKLRRVPITSEMERLLKVYKKERGECAEDDLVFVSINGKQLDRNDCNRNLKKYCQRAGIEKDLSNHALRHGCISFLLSKNVPATYVKDLAGHTSLTTTSRYAHTEVDDVRKYVEEAFI